jgi:hypothetical protein
MRDRVHSSPRRFQSRIPFQDDEIASGLLYRIVASIICWYGRVVHDYTVVGLERLPINQADGGALILRSPPRPYLHVSHR